MSCSIWRSTYWMSFRRAERWLISTSLCSTLATSFLVCEFSLSVAESVCYCGGLNNQELGALKCWQQKHHLEQKGLRLKSEWVDVWLCNDFVRQCVPDTDGSNQKVLVADGGGRMVLQDGWWIVVCVSTWVVGLFCLWFCLITSVLYSELGGGVVQWQLLLLLLLSFIMPKGSHSTNKGPSHTHAD